ncbi:MAG: sterol desaturase family protein [Opitutaceae bacterium]|nr:sterol desaturase family protein [Opitutaceae bacterium]
MSAADQSFITLVQQSRYAMAAVALATLWTIESVVPMFVGREHRLSHIAANFGLAAINAAVSAAFAFAILFVTEWAQVHHFGLLNLVPLPEWLQWVTAIVLFDCWQYWWHRLNHRVPLFWRFHSVHHADAELDASSGVRFHTGEILFSFLARLVVLPLIGLTIPQLLVYEALSLPIVLFHHSNVRLPGRVDRRLRWLIVTPWMHYVHHSRWQPETDSNYASFLSVWDRIFGSLRLRENPQEIALGLDRWQEHEWRRLPGMLAAPFRKLSSRDRQEPPRAKPVGDRPQHGV